MRHYGYASRLIKDMRPRIILKAVSAIFFNIEFGFLKVKRTALFMASSSKWLGNVTFNHAIGVRTSLRLPNDFN